MNKYYACGLCLLVLQLNNQFDGTYGQQWTPGEPRSFFVTADYTF
ncbi:hypothetical protein [Pseudomonas sp. MWU16-30323]|nr:hypothetical protein [Pseudomonas sp. MWU16-30323]